MPFALIVAGIVMLVASVRNTQSDLWVLLRGDFTGSGNFIYWFISIMLIGSIGYVKALRPLSNAFLTLVLIVLFLSRKGFFAQFQRQIQTTNTAPSTGSGSNSILPALPALPSLNDLFSGIHAGSQTSPFTIPDFAGIFR